MKFKQHMESIEQPGQYQNPTQSPFSAKELNCSALTLGPRAPETILEKILKFYMGFFHSQFLSFFFLIKTKQQLLLFFFNLRT